MAEVSSRQIPFPPKLKAAFETLRLTAQHPMVAQVILSWFGGEHEKLYDIKRNGSGKQVVLKYSSGAFVDILKLATRAYQLRAELTREEKEAYVLVLTATCLFSAENAGFFVNVSRARVTQWGARRPPEYPTARIGGQADMNTVNTALQWWNAKIASPNEYDADVLLKVANRAGSPWSVLARLTGRSMYELQRDIRRYENKSTETINVTILTAPVSVTSDSAAHAVKPESGTAGYADSSSESDGEYFGDQAEFEPDTLLRAPVPVSDGDDAFAPAVYLASDSEAASGDAGQSDTAQDGVRAGSEDSGEDSPAGTQRPVHPFFQSNGN